jgi:hypothetical protein
MTVLSDLDESQRQYFEKVCEITGGDQTAQVSMYEVGEMLGLDRDDAQNAAESLFGMDLIEIRSLSGGIGLMDNGAEACRRMAEGDAATGEPGGCLGTDPVLSDTDLAHTERITAKLKFHAGEQSWTFEALTDLMADLKTIDAQMLSSRPKTAVIRECFQSIAAVLENSGAAELAAEVRQFLCE